MRKQFGHLLPLTKTETEEIWEKGTLTVDANVLLDLYRYHPEIRDALIGALRAFEGRRWLSHQAASEFVRNRARAAAVVSKELSDADGDLNSLQAATTKATDDLRGRRPLSRHVGQRLKEDVEAAIRIARTAIEEQRARDADGASSDAVLHEVLSLFDGCVGSMPAEVELAERHKEAERRIKEKVPPGFADVKKDDAGAHGDYLMWHQVLQQAKSSAKPMIFVTSERKEDWWERAHGKTVGPRHELLEEAHRIAGVPVLLYRTNAFIAQTVGPLDGWLAALLLGDIRSQDRDDAVEFAHDELNEVMDDLVGSLGIELVASDASVQQLLAETKGATWSVSIVEVPTVEPVDGAAQLRFTAMVQYTCAPPQKGMRADPQIRAQIQGTITFKDGAWLISQHTVESVEIDRNDLDDPGVNGSVPQPAPSGPTLRTSR